MTPPVNLIANASTTWAAFGAIATLGATLVALLTAVIFTRRQTEFARRAAGNAHVSAGQSLESNKLALEALAIAREQLTTAMRSVAVVEDQVVVARDTIDASERPYLTAGPLTYNQAEARYAVLLTNCGKGPGRVQKAQLSLPRGDVIDGTPAAPITAVGESVRVTFPCPRGRPASGAYDVALTVVNAVGGDARYAELRFEAVDNRPWSVGAELLSQQAYRRVAAV